MRRVNLLPKEDRQRGISGLQGATLGVLLAGGAVVAIIVAIVSIFCILRLNALEDEISGLDSDITAQNQRLQELQPYSQLEGEIASKQPVADGIVRTRFAWDEFLQGLAFVIPEATSLDTLTAQASPVDVNAALDQTIEPSGTITFTGLSLPDYTNVADFIVRMNTMRFLRNSELDLAELDQETYSEDAINFEISSELLTQVGARDRELRLEDSNSTETASAAQDQYSAAEAQYSDGQENVVGSDDEQAQGTVGANEPEEIER